MKSTENQLEFDVLIPLFAKLSKEIIALITDRMKENDIDLTKCQTIVLSKLAHREKLAQHDLALITARDKTSLTRLLRTMERKELIQRSPCEHDGRVKNVSITDYGLSQYKKAVPIIQHIFTESEKGIKKEDITFTKNIIIKIYNNLNLNYEN